MQVSALSKAPTDRLAILQFKYQSPAWTRNKVMKLCPKFLLDSYTDILLLDFLNDAYNYI